MQPRHIDRRAAPQIERLRAELLAHRDHQEVERLFAKLNLLDSAEARARRFISSPRTQIVMLALLCGGLMTWGWLTAVFTELLNQWTS